MRRPFARRRLRAPRGVTLVEAMVVITILGIIALVGPKLMVQIQNFYLMTVARNESQRDARAAVAVMAKNLSLAKMSTISIDTPAGEQAYSRIVFRDVYGRSFQFFKSGKDIVMIASSVRAILARNVVYLAFMFPRSDDPSLVNIAVGISRDTYLSRKKYFALTVEDVKIFNKFTLGVVGGLSPETGVPPCPGF